MTTNPETQIETATRVIAARPALDRIGAIDARLPEIEAVRRKVNVGRLPKAELGDRLAHELGRIRLGFEQAGKGVTWDFTASDLIHRLNRDRGHIEVANVKQLLGLVVWLLGPDLEASARAAVERLEYVEGLSTEERRARTAS